MLRVFLDVLAISAIISAATDHSQEEPVIDLSGNPDFVATIQRSTDLKRSIAGIRVHDFKWRRFREASSDKVHVRNLHISPELKVTVAAEVQQHLDKLEVELDVRKYMGFGWVKIPCLGRIGSCTISDICKVIPQTETCPQVLQDANLPCSCPVAPGNYSVTDFQPVNSGHSRRTIPGWMIDGDFKVQAILRKDGKQLGSYGATFTVAKS